MSATLIPESAPFTAEQRAWLNGFFAGMLGIGDGASAAPLPTPAPPAAGEAEELPWHDPSLPLDERMRLADGKPVERRLMAAMAQLDCGACGYVCQSYAEAIASGAEKSLTRCAPGGKETSRMIKLLLKDAPSGPAAPSAVTLENKGDDPGPSRERPAEATVLALRNLNRPGSAKQTTHVELDLDGTGVRYRVGDSLGVYPTNCPDLVGEVLDALGAAGRESVPADTGEAIPLREALLGQRCLREVTDELLDVIGSSGVNGQAGALAALRDDLERLDRMDVLDVLRAFPSARPAPADFVAALRPLAPRLYSISSSPRAHPGRVHLTVARVAFEHGGRSRKGVASTMFSDRLAPGDRVRVFVQPSHRFTVPEDPGAPLIMVGPGTGIAPFRAFLQERRVAGAAGKNWLFFGDQREAFDFLYEEELREYLERGHLTRLDLAFSRDQDRKVYVQDRMCEQGAELFRWLEEGATFCVCGDAKRMAGDVDRALRRIVAEHGGMSAEAADRYVRDLTAGGRYLRDVY